MGIQHLTKLISQIHFLQKPVPYPLRDPQFYTSKVRTNYGFQMISYEKPQLINDNPDLAKLISLEM